LTVSCFEIRFFAKRQTVKGYHNKTHHKKPSLIKLNEGIFGVLALVATTRVKLTLNNRLVSIWLKFAQTCYSDRTVIHSGNEEIQGNKRSEIKAQLRVTF
jgi:hypothetical protein